MMKENLYEDAQIRESTLEECLCKNCIRILWSSRECYEEGFFLRRSYDALSGYNYISKCNGFEDYRQGLTDESEVDNGESAEEITLQDGESADRVVYDGREISVKEIEK